MRRVVSLIGALSFTLPVFVFAQNSLYCGDLPGCQSGNSGDWLQFAQGFLNTVLQILPIYAPGIATIFLIIGAGYLLWHLGDDQRAETGKKTITYSLIGLAVALFAQEFIAFVASENYFDTGAGGSTIFNQDTIFGVVLAARRILYTFFNTVLIIAIIYNAGRMIVSRGADDEYSKAKQGFFYAFIGAVILNIVDFIIWIIMNLGL